MIIAKERTLVMDLRGPEGARDWLVANLDDLGFEAFEETETGLRAYAPESAWKPDSEQLLVPALSDTGFVEDGRTWVEPTNWNASWEAGIQPVVAGNFVVHPPWHTPESGRLSICIEPKMSFGTAHHATTRLVLSMIERAVFPGARVLDAGTGTGVLAIAARKIGAASAIGFDIDPWSLENAVENLERNQVDGIEIRVGGIECIGASERFDSILANINRSVLIEMIPLLRGQLEDGGSMLLSGILLDDRELITAALDEAGMQVREVCVEGEWIAVLAVPGLEP